MRSASRSETSRGRLTAVSSSILATNGAAVWLAACINHASVFSATARPPCEKLGPLPSVHSRKSRSRCSSCSASSAASCSAGISRREPKMKLRLAAHGSLRKCRSRERRCSSRRSMFAGPVMTPTASVGGPVHSLAATNGLAAPATAAAARCSVPRARARRSFADRSGASTSGSCPRPRRGPGLVSRGKSSGGRSTGACAISSGGKERTIPAYHTPACRSIREPLRSYTSCTWGGWRGRRRRVGRGRRPGVG